MVKSLPAVQEAWVRSLGREDPLEKGVAAHSSIPACRIPRTEERGGLHTVHGVAKSRTRLERLTHTHTHTSAMRAGDTRLERLTHTHTHTSAMRVAKSRTRLERLTHTHTHLSHEGQRVIGSLDIWGYWPQCLQSPGTPSLISHPVLPG